MVDNDVRGHVNQGWCSTTGVIAVLLAIGRKCLREPFDCYGRMVASAWVTRWVSAEVQPAGAATAAQA
jgi:hypothetical protein